MNRYSCFLVLVCFVKGLLASTPPQQARRYTAVLIYGSFRSFEQTCSTIVEHVIKPNTPVRVVVSLDEENTFHVPVTVVECLSEYKPTYLISRIMNRTTTGDSWHSPRLFETALSMNVEFAFAIKIRTDVFCRRYFRIAPLYQPNLVSLISYSRFTESPHLRHLHGNELFWWIFSGGMTAFIRPMSSPELKSPWSLRHQMEWNKDLLDHTQTLRDTPYLDALAAVHEQFRVVYVVGSSWIHLGPFDVVRNVSLALEDRYGEYSWGNYGFNESTLQHPEGWRRVMESQLRLAHYYDNISLVDLQNEHDIAITFNYSEESSIPENAMDNSLSFFILRTCGWQSNRTECRQGRAL